MPRRIDIELTSALADGSYTWRAAGAREPKGVLDGEILPPGTAVGDELKVEIDQMVDGIEVLSVVKEREKSAPDLLELLPSEQPFEAVIETRAKRDRRDGDDRRGGRGRGRDGRGRDGRRRDRDRKDRDGDRDGRREREGGRQRRERPHFDPPPEVPQRPKPKRLRPGKKRRQEVLAELPEEQRPIAEVALQGMGAVRARLKEENEKLAADGKPVMPEASVMKMAEELLPKLRTADWLDRADAALAQMEQLDLRDLRSVVAASSDPVVVRDESTRAIAAELQEALVRKQEEELRLWLEDVDAALGVGRAIRALRLSSQPPKAGVMFPPDLARRLGEAATNSLTPEDSAERWAAVMEAAAFSPVRALVVPAAPPSQITDDLRATALRLGPLLPQIAVVLGVEVPADAPKPKPLRPQHRKDGKDGKGRQSKGGRRDADSRRGREQGSGRRQERQGDSPGKGKRPPRGSRQDETAAAASTDGASDAATSTADEAPSEPSAAPVVDAPTGEATATTEAPVTTEPETAAGPAAGDRAEEPAPGSPADAPAEDAAPAGTEPHADAPDADAADAAPAAEDAAPAGTEPHADAPDAAPAAGAPAAEDAAPEGTEPHADAADAPTDAAADTASETAAEAAPVGDTASETQSNGAGSAEEPVDVPTDAGPVGSAGEDGDTGAVAVEDVDSTS